MGIFDRKRNSKSYESNPPEQAIVPDTGLILNLWTAESQQGIRRHWSIAREGDKGAVYKTCRIECLFSLPLFVQKVARAFSQYEDLNPAMREHLRHLSSVMERAVTDLTANGVDKSNSSESKTSLNFE